jgi:hypothetical protein
VLDTDDRLYVADREAGAVTRISADGRRVLARRLERPVGLAPDPQGRGSAPKSASSVSEARASWPAPAQGLSITLIARSCF